MGAQLTPVVCYEYGEAGANAGLGWRGIDAGALPYTVDANDFDMDDTIGYRLPGSTYKSINIKFPEQIAMEPNTAYLFGYRLENDAQFALASQYLRYRDPADPRYLKALSTTADAHFYGTHRMIPANVLDVYVEDYENYYNNLPEAQKTDHTARTAVFCYILPDECPADD